jgi:putative transposase
VISLTGLDGCFKLAYMPRPPRKAPGGVIFHVLNRGVGRRCIFEKPQDYAAFERVMAHALDAVPVRLLAYCLMPNHWHLIVCPQQDGQLARFMQRLTMTHTRRWQEHYRRVGHGHLYQGRFKSFPVQDDRHFLIVARYVERNALRANLVERAEQWRWSSLWRRVGPGGDAHAVPLPLAVWPVAQPMDWLTWVNEPQTTAELDSLRIAITKGRPFGDSTWQQEMTKRLNLQSSHRDAGRPRKRKRAK